MRKKVIIDTDPGIDDALALLLALRSPELDVVGITVTTGNIEVERGVQNALNILEFMGMSHIPVYRGAEKPLVKSINITDDCHGSDGLGNVYLPKSDRTEEKLPAQDYLIEMGRQHPHDLSLICLAPFTTVAQAIQKDAEAMAQYESIVSMGGGVAVGNMNPVAEFNYWTDPDAARIVYEFSIPITMVGLNVTNRIVFTPSDFKFLQKYGGEIGRFMNEMHHYYLDYYWETECVFGCVTHDPLAVTVMCDPSLVKTTHCHVAIATDGPTRGECVADIIDAWKQEKNCYVALDVEWERFRDRFFTSMLPNCQREYEAYKTFTNSLIREMTIK